jgi:2-C-methyl-D-erythritol 4-phosphate cytidylyltransferase
LTAVNTFLAVVPAAGIGSRMKSSVAKQYLKIGSQTVIEHTLDALLSHPQIKRIVVVLHPNDAIFDTLQVSQHPQIDKVIGGDERVDSVLRGLQHCHAKYSNDESAWVLVHDAARPCLTHSEIDDLLASANTCDGAILAVPVADTIKKANNKSKDEAATIQETIDRSQLWQAQTPQFFPLAKLIDAIQLARHDEVKITDEASAMEHCNANIKLVEGRSTNIKITRPSDLSLASFYLNTVSTNNNK